MRSSFRTVSSHRQKLWAVALWGAGVLAISSGSVATADPWADRVIQYDPGTGAAAGYTDPSTALGMPTRFTGEVFGFPSVVSLVSPPFESDELVSIGEGGRLTVEFDDPIKNDPQNPFGVDLILFGNGGFIYDFGTGRLASPGTLFGLDLVRVSVSADGATFVPLGDVVEGFYPTQAYLDGGPFDVVPGSLPTDFRKPVNPALTAADFGGLTYEAARALYGDSGGGTPLDIAASGLGAVRFVRIDVLDDGDPDTELSAEIDAFATVPEPAGATVFVAGLFVLGAAFRRG
ncbi:MAG: hypothetical protein AB7Q17_00835 [Phycisphaerae bacterium]